MARELLNGIDVPIPETGESYDVLRDLRLIAETIPDGVGEQLETPGTPPNLAIAKRDERNVLDYGVERGTTASQTTALKAALEAHPGDSFYFPPGDYRFDTPVLVTANNSLRLADGARLYAGAAMDTLIDYDSAAASANDYAQDKFIVGRGTIDGALLANKALAIGSVIRFSLGRGLTVQDGRNRGVLLKPTGAEVIGHDLRVHNTGTTNSHKTPTVTTASGSTTVTAASGTFEASDVGSPILGSGIPHGAVITAFTSSSSVTISAAATASATVAATVLTNIAIEANMGDCRFSHVITRDCTVGIWDRRGNTWFDVQPWIGTTAQLTVRYPVSVAFLLAADSTLIAPYADTCRTSYRIATAGVFARIRMTVPRVFCNTGNLTNALAAASPGICFDLTDGAAEVNVVDPRLQGHGVTGHAFTAGATTRFNCRHASGNVSNLADWRRGVRLGTISFSPTVIGATVAGSQDYTAGGTGGARSGSLIVSGDGIATWRVLVKCTLDAAISGKLRVTDLPLPTGATAVSNSAGAVGFSKGVDANGVIGWVTTTAAALTVLLQKYAAGAAAEPEAGPLAGTIVEVWFTIQAPFTFPS